MNTTVRAFQRLLSASAEIQVPVASFNFVQRLTKDSELIVCPKTQRVIQGLVPEIFFFVESYLYDTQVLVSDR